jgi:hypothetical protein
MGSINQHWLDQCNAIIHSYLAKGRNRVAGEAIKVAGKEQGEIGGAA